MVKGIKIRFNGKTLDIEYINPVRTKNIVIFSNSGNLLLWEPNELKSTKTEMKQYVTDVAKALSDIIGPTSLLAHGLIKYDWMGGKDFDVKIGPDTIAKVTYVDEEYEKIDSLTYRPKYAALITIPNFI